jgi:hypothetical protein
MYISAIGILTTLLFGTVLTQTEPQCYRLQTGEKYFLEQKLIQITESDSREMKGNTSLDINCRLLMEVVSVTDNEYQFDCQYQDLEISFFSPRSDIYVSSLNKTFQPVEDYLNELEKQTFSIQMSKYGKLLHVEGLDSIINSLIISEMKDTLRHELITKTIRDAFGESALKTLASIVLNVYSKDPAESHTNSSTIYLNSNPFTIRNNLYLVSGKNNTTRIQGVGTILETENITQYNELMMINLMQGKQTYDFLVNNDTGWIIEGVSKQKIYSISTIRGHDELPDGLKIPSYTESEYLFRGGRVG